MVLSIARLRRWIVFAAILICVLVVAAYFHARHSVQNALRQVPERLNIQVQQSAQGFSVSKSEQGRTLFKLQASKAVQFKGGGRAELHDVMITIYGRDSSRFDQIYGKTFEYDQPSGNVTSRGEVSIDMQANPKGTTNPDQATPKELKNPIHLKTTELVFNQKTGNAWTPARVEFYVPQISGSAIGANYDAKQNTLTLQSQVRMVVTGATPMTILAQHATLEKDPRQIVLLAPQTESSQQHGSADEATLFLRDDNSLNHAIATGNVAISSIRNGPKISPITEPKSGATISQITSQKLEVAMRRQNQIDAAVFSGDVHFQSEGKQSSEGSAGRAVLSFGPRNTVSKIHTEQQARLLEHQASAGKPTQDIETSAPIIDLFLKAGNRLTRAETAGPPMITLLPISGERTTETRVTADKFTAKFDSLGQLSQVHGEANARVVSTAPPQDNVPQPDRVSTSDMIDAYFHSGTGIETLVQQGKFKYVSGTQQAFADRARYTPADQIVLLTGTPRIVDSGMETTATTVRLNRETAEAFASGDVKTTYSDLKTQASGALLASSAPIHVTSETMTVHNNPGVATYKGSVRLWQDANMVEAPTVEFHRDRRFVIASSTSQQKVSTDLISTDKNGKSTQVHVTSDHLTYLDSERKAHYEGSVVAQSTDVTVKCNQMDVFFAANSSAGNRASSPGTSSTGGTPVAPQPQTQAKLDKIIASSSVLVTQPARHATGERLVYTASDDKFVMTGGPPSIFDAEHGKITGVSLTLYRTDDRVIVDGTSSSPAVTENRVER